MVKQVLKSTISIELLKSEAVILIIVGSEYLQVVDWNGISSLFNFLSHRHAPYDNQMGCPSHLRRWRLHAHPIQGGGAIPTVPKKVDVASSFHSQKYGGVPSPFKKGGHDELTSYKIFHHCVHYHIINWDIVYPSIQSYMSGSLEKGGSIPSLGRT